ncbi:hypothetical protein GO755_32020 [Spirosoma sp. HMF4905]|uniref:Uncharacterized protein n=1 Tax=Spirosoma arboris TaxID=2682092 RepID=A0A7K1SLL3_9BACT|nr:hypothetical protein [Spirosoma arboris]MVM34699.1 hypothetical protein [Spirosoma arboris]
MTALLNHLNPSDADLIDAPIGQINLGMFKNQSGAAIEDGDDTDEETTDEDLDDEPVDEDGDPTGEHDHHQDDNYALGGHVTRSGSL